jgi:hypothetical protein
MPKDTERSTNDVPESDELNENELRLIFQKSDHATTVAGLVQQFRSHLPLRNFGDLRSAVAKRDGSKKNHITFRQQDFHIRHFEGKLPDEFFPINDLETLVTRAAQVVQAVPDHIGRDPDNVGVSRLALEQAPTLARSVSSGLIGPPPSPGMQTSVGVPPLRAMPSDEK